MSPSRFVIDVRAAEAKLFVLMAVFPVLGDVRADIDVMPPVPEATRMPIVPALAVTVAPAAVVTETLPVPLLTPLLVCTSMP
jgi:hypothetical protein